MSKIVPYKPFLLILFGLPGAGKTYLARQLAEEVQAANLQADRIRHELFPKPQFNQEENNLVAKLMDYMTEEFLSAGVSVIYDVNAMRGSQRKTLREMARHHNALPILVWIQIDVETAFVRNIRRDRRRADDRFSGGWDRTTFDSIAAYMQKPDMRDDPIVVSGKHNFSAQRSAILARLREKGALHVQDSTSNVAKPGMVNLVPGNTGRVDLSRRNIVIR